jgi:hypothetical protein
VSAQPDGTVDVDRTAKYSYEWFTVYPQDCLNNIECDCSKEINENDYDFAGVVFDNPGGTVEAFKPEQASQDSRDS